MRNEVIEAVKNHLKQLTEFSVVGSEYGITLTSEVEDELFTPLLGMFPLICVDFRKENRERKGGGKFQRLYRGQIIVGVLNFNLETAYFDLNEAVNKVFEKLFEIPTPKVENINLKFEIQESVPGHNSYREDGFYISEVIPCNIDLWI